MYLGIDIGTTSICAVVLNREGKAVCTVTENNTFGQSLACGERTQDAEKIALLCCEIYRKLSEKYDIESIGVSGQMHGILYVDKNGQAVSPLYSWQDERGNMAYSNSTYVQTLSCRSGYKLATGFGTVSVFYDAINGKIPKQAVSVCTIGDYVAMKLSHRTKPLLHETNAASIGLYDVQKHKWDCEAIKKAGLPLELFPEVSLKMVSLGETEKGAYVYNAVGDNQASVYGSLREDDSLLVNIGTGSQVSVLVKDYCVPAEGCEIRPYFKGNYLLLGCALCGGYSYRLLKNFYNSIFEGEERISYEKMNTWAKEAKNKFLPEFSTTFRGTRQDPNRLASIKFLSEENFNVQALTLSVLKGISAELKKYYEILAIHAGERKNLVGAGNAIRLNPVLREILQEDYKKELYIPANKEEAAFGAALLAAEAKEKCDLKNFISYETVKKFNN